MQKSTALLIAVGAVLFTASLVMATSLTGESNDAARINNAFGTMPLYFIENQGQLPEDVGYYIQGYDKTLYFTPYGVTFSLASRASGGDMPQNWVVKMDFIGASSGVRPRGENRQEAVFSYFLGQPENWHTGLPTYSNLVYSELWPGIDLVYTGDVNRMKYEFVVKPGADPNQIRLAYRGATSVFLSTNGTLTVKTPVGGFDDAAPYAYQVVDGQLIEVPAAYALSGSEGSFEYCFNIGSYDPTRTLILDPASLIYCGYIGGSGEDMGWGITVDNQDCAYVTGETYSTAATFPETVGPGLIYNGNGDAFVAKVNAAGTGLVYCGYIGGSQWDVGYGIDVDNQGSAYITGYTSSPNFPLLACPFPYMGSGDAFIVKVVANGAALLYSGCIGGTDLDEGHAVAVDALGNAYVTGRANSDQSTEGFPVLTGPDLTYNGGDADAFVCKIDPICGAFAYCGYIGGASTDEGNGITAIAVGLAYVTGSTSSTQATFPETVGPDLTHNGGYDAFVAAIDPFGAAIIYCGYIGGTDNDFGYDIAWDGQMNAYVTGETYSDHVGEGFPVLIGPDLTYNGSVDAFVAKVVASGQNLLYCGYIGGTLQDYGFGIGVDVGGRAYVAGNTWSSEAQGFPVLVGPDLTFNGGGVDAFVSRVSPNGAALQFSGYIGGDQVDWSAAADVGPKGDAYTTGEVVSNQATFPELVGPDLSFNGATDAFVAKINCCVSRGDVNGDGSVNVVDVTYLVAYLKGSGGGPPCEAEGDVDASGTVNVADVTYLVAFLKGIGSAPPSCP